MNESSQDDSPLLDGGQGRTGEELETQTVAFSRTGLVLISVIVLAYVVIALWVVS